MSNNFAFNFEFTNFGFHTQSGASSTGNFVGDVTSTIVDPDDPNDSISLTLLNIGREEGTFGGVNQYFKFINVSLTQTGNGFHKFMKTISNTATVSSLNDYRITRFTYGIALCLSKDPNGYSRSFLLQDYLYEANQVGFVRSTGSTYLNPEELTLDIDGAYGTGNYPEVIPYIPDSYRICLSGFKLTPWNYSSLSQREDNKMTVFICGNTAGLLDILKYGGDPPASSGTGGGVPDNPDTPLPPIELGPDDSIPMYFISKNNCIPGYTHEIEGPEEHDFNMLNTGQEDLRRLNPANTRSARRLLMDRVRKQSNKPRQRTSNATST